MIACALALVSVILYGSAANRMAIALAQSFNSQPDALRYAYAGLYTMDQVVPFIHLAAVCAVSFLMFMICSFMDLGRE